MKNYYCADPLCLARVEIKGELCDDCSGEKEYTYTSEQGKMVKIDTVEQAKTVIIATATVRELNMLELLKDKDITDVANCFDIDLNDLSIEINPDPNDFTYTYTFEK